MTSSFDRGPDRCPKPVPQHSSNGSPKTVHKKSGRFSSLASLRPSVTSLSQGICCHLFASADGLMTVASRVSSAALGEGCLASAGAWARTSRAGPCAPAATARTAPRSNRRAPRTKLVRDMVISPLSRVFDYPQWLAPGHLAPLSDAGLALRWLGGGDFATGSQG